MKKISFVVLSVIVSTLMLSMPFTANAASPAQTASSASTQTSNISNNNIANFHVDYNKDLGHKGRSYNQIANSIENNGVAPSDAQFYAKMDILTSKLEQSNTAINFDNVQSVDQGYANLHPDEMRQRTLNLDLPALKRLLSCNDSLFFGVQDVEKAMKTAGSVANGNNVGKSITVSYPDGSSVTATFKTVRDSVYSNIVKTDTNISGPWNYNALILEENIGASGSYTTTTTWSFQSGSGYATVEDVYKWSSNYNGSSGTTSYISDSGAVSCDGTICNVASEVDSNYQNTSAPNANSWIQGYTDGRFVISTSYSGTFSAVYLSLSITATKNTYWHDYAISEVSGGYPIVLHWAGEFK
jgi:hypothetical protein